MHAPDTSLVLGNVAEHQGHTQPPSPSPRQVGGQSASMAMAPSLRTLLDRIGPLGPTVVAGAGGLDRRVLSAMVHSDGAAPDAHTLLVVADVTLADTTADLVRAADARAAAGIVLTRLRDLPVDLVQAANDLGLPVVVLDDTCNPPRGRDRRSRRAGCPPAGGR